MSRQISGRWGGGLIATALAGVLVVTAPAGADQAGGHHAAGEVDENVQKLCPVMTGNEISKDIYTDYKSKRVFFCCQECKSSFLADPEKYLPRLPQFASGEQSDGHHGLGGFKVGQLVKPTGIATLSLVTLTVSLGLLRRMKRLNTRIVLKIHKTCGICALCMGLTHATIILLTH